MFETFILFVFFGIIYLNGNQLITNSIFVIIVSDLVL